MPTTSETIEWVRQYHWPASEDGAVDFCFNCGADWPCVPARLADAVECMTGELASVRLQLSNFKRFLREAEDDIGRLREALDEIIEMTVAAENMNEPGMIHQAGEIARAALEAK